MNNPLYKKATTPYKDGGEYYLLIQGDYGPHERPPTPHWVKVKYLVDSQGMGNFVSPALPRKEDYRIKDVLFKDVSDQNITDICRDSLASEYEYSSAVHNLTTYKAGFLRGLDFAEKFL